MDAQSVLTNFLGVCCAVRCLFCRCRRLYLFYVPRSSFQTRTYTQHRPVVSGRGEPGWLAGGTTGGVGESLAGRPNREFEQKATKGTKAT